MKLMETKTYTVYSLTCPVDGLVKYIGVTSRPLKERLAGHCREKRNDAKRQWISELKEKGLKPLIISVETCNINHRAAEQKWMNRYKGTILNIQQNDPTSIYTIRFDKEKLEDLQKRHGVKLYNYLKGQMDKIHDNKRIPSPDAD